MRTTVELTAEQRARLLELAAQRGMKGFSTIVQEAIDRYLDETAAREERTRAALEVLGTFDDESADALTSEMQRNRESWR